MNVAIRIRYILFMWVLVLSFYVYYRMKRETFLMLPEGAETVMVNGTEVIKPKLTEKEEAQRIKLQDAHKQAMADNIAAIQLMADAENNIIDVKEAAAKTISQEAAKLEKLTVTSQAAFAKKEKYAQWKGNTDKRLKEDLTEIGGIRGVTVYSWSWNEVAMSTYGLRGREVGVLAQDLPADMVVVDTYGYLQIRPGTWVANMVDNIRARYLIR